MANQKDTDKGGRRHTALRLQLAMATLLALFGCALFVASFIVPPTGIIHSSVLVATGEVFTFSGSLLGLDYSYKAKYPTLFGGKEE